MKVALDADGGPFKRGKHWFIIAETANGSDPLTEWNKIKPAFLENGWTLVKEYRGGGLREVLQYAKNGGEAWAGGLAGQSLQDRRFTFHPVALPWRPLACTPITRWPGLPNARLNSGEAWTNFSRPRLVRAA